MPQYYKVFQYYETYFYYIQNLSCIMKSKEKIKVKNLDNLKSTIQFVF